MKEIVKPHDKFQALDIMTFTDKEGKEERFDQLFYYGTDKSRFNVYVGGSSAQATDDEQFGVMVTPLDNPSVTEGLAFYRDFDNYERAVHYGNQVVRMLLGEDGGAANPPLEEMRKFLEEVGFGEL